MRQNTLYTIVLMQKTSIPTHIQFTPHRIRTYGSLPFSAGEV